MPKSGQARVLTAEQQDHVFDVIQHHRHPEKNTAIMQISFKLGLRAQEIALLQVKEIAKLNPSGTEFKLLEVMSLPAAYTKGADAMGRSQSRYQRKTVSFDVASFNQVIRHVGRKIPRTPFWFQYLNAKIQRRDLSFQVQIVVTKAIDIGIAIWREPIQ
ncbi:MAG: hypothetical protein AAFN81_14930 [Bacteroidota bacterium]